MLNLTINNKNVHVEEGTTILKAARDNGIYIPTLCYDDAVKVYGACGLCVVEAQGIPKLLRSCSAKCSEGMIINTESERVVQSRKIAMELLMSAHDGDCIAPCQLNCPARTDCQGYVGLIANGEYEAALKLIKDKIPLPASIGRVCPHPCETACRRGRVDEPINIAQLKSFAADIDLNKDKYVPETKPETGRKIAVIGGGPAGLTVAYRLAIQGHEVHIYDMMEKMGGMLRYGIPQYRLPKEILDEEISIIEKTGVKMNNNLKLGKDFTINSLKSFYDAVIVAVGAWKSGSMRTPGEELDGVIGGIDFLRDVALKNRVNIGEKVVICGGGNTAMDACRTAVRLGAKEIYCVYRRTRNEMPAEDIEITEAEEEGVQFKFLTNPISFNGENGKVNSITLQIMELGEPDASGRRKPIPVEGKTEEIAVDSVIVAIGQKLITEDVCELKLTDRGNIEADIDTFKTNIDGVFAIGDATNRGASIAIEAIGEANRCAVAVNAYLSGEEIETRVPYISRRDEELIDFTSKEKCPAKNPKILEPDKRKNNFDEVCLGYTEADAKDEASRCLECGCKEYYKCRLLNVAQRYDIHPERFKGEMPQKYTANSNEFIERNSAKCILCGLCVRSCKEVMDISAIGLLGRGFKTEVAPAFNLPLDQTKCNNCGLCVKLCPTGALTEKSSLAKQVPLDEKYSEQTVKIGSHDAKVLVSKYDGKVIRVIPDDNTSRNSGLSREELASLIK